MDRSLRPPADKAPSRQFNILYDSLVNAVRDEIPASVERICAKAITVETSEERQRIALSNEETISARLVVLANGLNVGLRHQLGIAQKVMSACHIAGELKIRPVDLYVNDAGHQPGVVLVGDAFATSCPVAGYRLRQGIHRHRTALQCPHPAMAGC